MTDPLPILCARLDAGLNRRIEASSGPAQDAWLREKLRLKRAVAETDPAWAGPLVAAALRRLETA